jgi:hypothetical protein
LTKILTANRFLRQGTKGEKFHLSGVLYRAAVLEKIASKKRKSHPSGRCDAASKHIDIFDKMW